jgi:putative ABC transport system substrate-binding protein
VRRIGVLLAATADDPEFQARVGAFLQGLQQSGWTIGRNVRIDTRWATTDAAEIRRHAAELAALEPDVILTAGASTLGPLLQTTRTVPIVFAFVGDPVGAGLVASLNRPGGNVTGVTFVVAELGAKQLGLLHELQPGAVRVGVLVDPNYPSQSFVSDVQAAALSIGKQIEVLEAPTGRDIDTVFERLAQKPIDALLVGPSPMINNRHVQLATLAARHTLPAIANTRVFPETGLLMSYGTSITDAYRQAGAYVGRIVKGEKPGDLPVTLPTKFHLLVNLKTAKSLRIEIPPSLLARADEVIE